MTIFKENRQAIRARVVAVAAVVGRTKRYIAQGLTSAEGAPLSSISGSQDRVSSREGSSLAEGSSPAEWGAIAAGGADSSIVLYRRSIVRLGAPSRCMKAGRNSPLVSPTREGERGLWDVGRGTWLRGSSYRGLIIASAMALALSNPLTANAEPFYVSSALEVSSLALNPAPRHPGVIADDNRYPANWGGSIKIIRGTWDNFRSIGENDSTEFSTKKIVRLLTANGEFACTGSVIAPTIVLTAAHCLHWNGKWIKNPASVVYVETYDGQRFRVHSRSVSGSYKGSPLANAPQSTTADQWSVDAGLIYLSKQVTSVTDGFLDIMRRDGENYIGFSLIGFHGDVEDLKPKQLLIESSWKSDQFPGSQSCSGDLRGIAERGRRGRERGDIWYGYGTLIVHRCDTTPGSSGSPLVLRGRYIAGVHVANGGGEALAVNLAEDVGRGGPFDWIHKRAADNRERYGWRQRNDGTWQGPSEVPWRTP